MSVFSGPNFATDGLVFHYDMSNTQKSWKGKPTVNYITNPTNEVIATASEFAVFQDLSPVFDTYGEGSYSITADIKTPKPGSITVYTASGGVEYNIGYFSAACEAYYKTFYFNNISVTRTDAGQTVSNLSFYGGYGSGLFPSIKNVQVEKNSFATPFVVGTRSNTQAILDLTNNNTITANSLAYNSDGTFTFAGGVNYLTPSSLDSLVGDVTLEAAVNLGTRNGAHQTAICTDSDYQYGIKLLASYHGNMAAWIGFGSTNYIITAGSLENTGNNIIACTRSSTTGLLTLYLNGVLVASGTGTTGNMSSSGSGKGRVGIEYHSGGYGFNGKIYFAKAYNRVLSAAEIQQNFNAQRTRYGI